MALERAHGRAQQVDFVLKVPQAKGVLFLARRAGKVVGRVAAGLDERYNQFHGTQDGFVGFFESQNDPGLAAAQHLPPVEHTSGHVRVNCQSVSRSGRIRVTIWLRGASPAQTIPITPPRAASPGRESR